MEFLKEYIINILAVVLISSLCETFLPEGNMKKYSASIIGLAVIAVLILPITSIDEIQLNMGYSVPNKVTASVDDSEYNKEVLKEYSEKVEKHIEEKGGGKVKAFVIASSKDIGKIDKVKLVGNSDTALISYIINDLGVSRYDIEIRKE